MHFLVRGRPRAHSAWGIMGQEQPEFCMKSAGPHFAEVGTEAQSSKVTDSR